MTNKSFAEKLNAHYKYNIICVRCIYDRVRETRAYVYFGVELALDFNAFYIHLCSKFEYILYVYVVYIMMKECRSFVDNLRVLSKIYTYM